VPHKTRLTPPRFIEMPVSSQESECLYISVLWVSVLTLSTIFLSDFETVPRVALFSFYYVDYDLRQIILSAIKRYYFNSRFFFSSYFAVLCLLTFSFYSRRFSTYCSIYKCYKAILCIMSLHIRRNGVFG